MSIYIYIYLLLSAVVSVHCQFFRTLLYGENFKGFLSVSPVDTDSDEYTISFDIKQSSGDARWSIHMSSAPYDMAVMTDNCKRAKKSPHVLRDKKIENTTVSGTQIIGHTVVLYNQDDVLACATVILPGQPLLRAVFHTATIEGSIHLIPLKDKVRILPDLRYVSDDEEFEPAKEIIGWAFVEKCGVANVEQNSDGSELGVNSRSTITLEIPTNYTLISFALFRDGKTFACSPIQDIEMRVVASGDIYLGQPHCFEPVRIITVPPPSELHIRDDCLDLSTESVHKSYQDFSPTINIFGPESIALKSLFHAGLCSALRPQYPRPASTAVFLHPIMGRLVIVDSDDKILLTGELRNLFDATSTRASVQVRKTFTSSAGCLQYEECADCYTVEDAAVIVGKDENPVTLSGVYPWFDLEEAKSIMIDLQWTKICANLTYLPTGGISVHALIKRISPVSSPTVASIVAIEYPANNLSEVLINKRQSFNDAAAHYRPLDSSITSGPPCGEQNLGPSKPVFWTAHLKHYLGLANNDSTAMVGVKFITGSESVLGTSVLLTAKKEVFCGSFEPLLENTVAFAKFSEPFVGYVKLTQYGTSNWATGLPTEVYYSLSRMNSTDTSGKPETIDWDFVDDDNMTCKGAMVFNPFQMNDTSCSLERSIFCPIGSATNKSGPLLVNARRHIVTQNLPLSGPYSVIGKSVRLHGSGNAYACEELKEFKKASFRWVVYTNRSLTEIQKDVSDKLNVELYQVEVDYTRELYQAKCSIYRITILEEDEKLAEILDMFDVEQKKFKSEEELQCGGKNNKSQSKPAATPSPSSATTKTSSSIILLFVSVASMLYVL